MKNLITFSLLSVEQTKNNNLAFMGLRILTISKYK